jgi:hypothetical protein
VGQPPKGTGPSPEPVVLISHSNDTGAHRDAEPAQTVGMTATVEPLMMVTDHGGSEGEELEWRYQLRPDDRMAMLQDGLLSVTGARDRKFADVVQQPGLTDHLGFLGRESRCEREAPTELRHSLAVAVGSGFAPFDRTNKGPQDDLGCALPRLVVPTRTLRRRPAPGDLQPGISSGDVVRGPGEAERHALPYLRGPCHGGSHIGREVGRSWAAATDKRTVHVPPVLGSRNSHASAASASTVAADAIHQRMIDAWNAGDGVAFATPFTDDADFVGLRERT